MKKLFTLVALALVAMSASAKETIELPDGMGPGVTTEFGNWEWKTVKSLFTGEDVDQATASDAGVVYYDASAFDYLVIKYKECTIKTNFGIQYNTTGEVDQWGPIYNVGSIEIAPNTSGLVGIKLDDHKNKCYSVYLQTQGVGSMIIEEVYFATTAEYEADAAANPVVAWYPATKELNLDNATNTWGNATYDAATHTATLVNDHDASGWWVNGGDYSYYDYFVVEFAGFQRVSYAQFEIFGQKVTINNVGNFIMVIDISAMTRNQPNGFNLMIQGGAGTTWTWKQAYFATADYVAQNNIHDEVVYGDTQEFSLADLAAGWNSEYDAATATISVTGEEGGKGWWVNPADYSHFDNFVVEFEATTAAGKVVVEYADPDAAAPALAPQTVAPDPSEAEFGVGATCVVVPLNAEGKSAVKQLYVMGSQDATFTIKKAYVAVASATPEANVGTGIAAINAEVNVNAPMYNLAGQRVDAQFKGIVIQNGRKFMQK